MAGFATVAAVLAGVAVFIRIIYLRLLPKPIPGLPCHQDSTNRILGDAPYFIEIDSAGGFWLKFFTDLLSKTKTPIAQFFPGPFDRTHVVIADYREARDLLSKRSKDLSRGYTNNMIWQGVIPEHFIAMEDAHPSFKDAKFLTKDLMTPSFLHGVSAPASYKTVRKFIELWKSKAAATEGLPFEADEDLEAFTYDIMNTAAFGVPVEESYIAERLRSMKRGPSLEIPREAASEEKDKKTSLKVATFLPVERPELLFALDTLNRRVTGAFRAMIPSIFFLFDNLRPTIQRAFRSKRSILQSHIDRSVEKLSRSDGEENFASAVDYVVSREKLAAENAGRKPAFDSLRMSDMLWGYIVGGQDSTHSTLCFTAKYLGSNQDVQSKLRENLRAAYLEAVAEKREPTIDEIVKTNVPYLDAFIEETLRLSSPAGAIMKDTLRDMDIVGYHVPKGTPIMFLLTGPTIAEAGAVVDEKKRSETSQKLNNEGVEDWGRSRFPAESFLPERWLQPGENGQVKFNGQAGPFMSFSLGPRGCWGKRLAYLELKLIITLLVWNLDFGRLPTEMEDDGLVEGLFTKPKSCLVKLKAVKIT
ncbi:cytochrome p450 [Colletotrichum asianum]|uniref:Cytochrome p450 n=1 Tax=Colletotrichum asianum TaxID=702518 RepID=A0A8H3ZKF6_9PEZI|nr:cytochrome p450 [Colletotrichum asianum]